MRLAIRIWRSDVGSYRASCPSLPGCVSTGQTAQQARDKLKDAITGYLASVNNFVPQHIDQILEPRN